MFTVMAGGIALCFTLLTTPGENDLRWEKECAPVESKPVRDDEWERLWSANERVAIQVARRYSNSRDEAEELIQEIRIEVWKKRSQFEARNGAGFSSWMWQVAWPLCLRFRRKRNRPWDDPIDSDIPDHSPSPVEVSLDKERKREIDEALRTLDSRNRRVVELFYFEKLSIKEIEHTMGLTQTNIKAILSRSRAKLKPLLQHLINEKGVDRPGESR